MDLWTGVAFDLVFGWRRGRGFRLQLAAAPSTAILSMSDIRFPMIDATNIFQLNFSTFSIVFCIAMPRSKTTKRKNSGGASSTSNKKSRRKSDGASSTSLSPSATFMDLPVDITTRITSYMSITMMAALSLSCTCKSLRAAVEHHLETYAKSITKQRWNRLPRPLVTLAYDDASRMNINGVTKKTAMALMIPDAVLRKLRYTSKRLSRRCTAHVYKVSTIVSHLSSVYPTVEEFETALKTKNQKSSSARSKREENKRTRAGRQAEIQAIMKEHNMEMEYQRDADLMSLVKKYVANGAKKNLAKIKEEVIALGLQNARRAEVDELVKVSGVDCRTIKLAEKEEYAKTGDDGKLESIKETIQIEKDRLGRLEGYRKAFHKTLLELVGGEQWILQVPDYVWTRNAIIREFLDYGRGDVTEACTGIVSILRAKQEEKDGDTKTPSAIVMKKYVKVLRREDLVHELRQHGLSLRKDSNFCEQFIQGTTEASLQEVGATMALSAHLFQHGGHRCWSHNAAHLEGVMRKRYGTNECDSWYDAFESVKSLVDHSYRYDSDDEYYSDY